MHSVGFHYLMVDSVAVLVVLLAYNTP